MSEATVENARRGAASAAVAPRSSDAPGRARLKEDFDALMATLRVAQEGLRVARLTAVMPTAERPLRVSRFVSQATGTETGEDSSARGGTTSGLATRPPVGDASAEKRAARMPRLSIPDALRDRVIAVERWAEGLDEQRRQDLERHTAALDEVQRRLTGALRALAHSDDRMPQGVASGGPAEVELVNDASAVHGPVSDAVAPGDPLPAHQPGGSCPSLTAALASERHARAVAARLTPAPSGLADVRAHGMWLGHAAHVNEALGERAHLDERVLEVIASARVALSRARQELERRDRRIAQLETATRDERIRREALEQSLGGLEADHARLRLQLQTHQGARRERDSELARRLAVEGRSLNQVAVACDELESELAARSSCGQPV